jgi:2-oxoglutarate ferredoxin oxidoreductase subunit beta
LTIAIAADCSFIARGFAGDTEHLAELIKQGIQHKGFALIDILQPCVTFNRKNTYDWYRERVYKLNETDYDPSNKPAAFEKAQEWGIHIPIGIIYKKEKTTFEEQIPALKKGTLVRQKIDPNQIEKLLQEFV